MKIPGWLLRYLPMWEHICPKCRKQVTKNSHKCPHCGEKYPLTLKVPPSFLGDPKKLEAYVHQHVFPKVSEFERHYLTQYFTILFEDGFESGNFIAWTSTTGSAGETQTVETNNPHHFIYNAKFSNNGSAFGEFSVAKKNLGALYPEAYMRAYVKFDTFPTVNAKSLLVLSFEDPFTVGIVYAGVYRGIGDADRYWIIRGYSGAGLADFTIADPTIAINQYYCLELYAKIDALAGIYTIWVNGVEKVNVSGLVTNARGNVRVATVGMAQREDSTASNVYVDCVVVADNRIRCELSPKGNNINQAKLTGII